MIRSAHHAESHRTPPSPPLSRFWRLLVPTLWRRVALALIQLPRSHGFRGFEVCLIGIGFSSAAPVSPSGLPFLRGGSVECGSWRPPKSSASLCIKERLFEAVLHLRNKEVMAKGGSPRMLTVTQLLGAEPELRGCIFISSAANS